MEEKEIIQLAVKTAIEQYKVDVGRLFTVSEAAEHLKVSKTTIYAMVKAGDIEAVEVWRQKRFTFPAIEACKKKAGNWN